VLWCAASYEPRFAGAHHNDIESLFAQQVRQQQQQQRRRRQQQQQAGRVPSRISL
jgi:hypothetical protein